MRIADHCRPGGWRYNGTPYDPRHPWPGQTLVQFGARGLVFSASGNYTTAFFEAFPDDPPTFIRGEGATLEQAEDQAWEKFQRQQACAGHEFERRRYTNGAGVCKHCNLFLTEVFEPLTRCVVCDVPTAYQFAQNDPPEWRCEAHALDRSLDEL